MMAAVTTKPRRAGTTKGLKPALVDALPPLQAIPEVPDGRSTAKAAAAGEVIATGRKELPRQMFLPGMEPDRRALPADIASSSLFVPWTRRQGERPRLSEVVLASSSTVKITFSGKRLDEGAADVVMALILEHQLRAVPAGELLVIHAHELLTRLGRAKEGDPSDRPSGKDYKWLRDQVRDLRRAALTFEAYDEDKPRTAGAGSDKETTINIIGHYDYIRGRYEIKIDPRFANLYGAGRFTLIDWNLRQALPVDDQLPRALQRLISTTSDPVYRRSVTWLRDALARTAGREDDFINALQRALERLKEVGFVQCKDGASWFERNKRGELMLVAKRVKLRRAAA